MHLLTILLMSNGVSQVLQLLAGLSLLVALHEFGHFFFARLFKTRVEKFYLFFDFLFPFSGLLNFALFKKKVGDTEYGIGWFPLGGYVKIAGMVDESMDKEQMALPPQPWEYRSKKPYQRLFIMLGGIIMNVLVAVIIYMFNFGIYGDKYLPNANAKYGITVDSVGRSMGLLEGDFITAVDNKPITRFNEIVYNIIFHKDSGTISITRHGKDTLIYIPKGTIANIISARKAGNRAIIQPRIPTIVDSVIPNSIAQKAHLQKGDSIVSVNGKSTVLFIQFDSIKRALFGTPMSICFYRNNVLDSINVVIPKDSILGFTHFSPELKTEKFNPIQAIGKGFSFTYDQFLSYLAQFKLFGKEVKVSESLGGFGSIAKGYAADFNIQGFFLFTAFLSIMLAFMNLLPIPGLDGGYVIFLLFEMLTGKKVSEKVMEWTTSIGLVILLILMVYANGLDIFRHFHLIK